MHGVHRVLRGDVLGDRSPAVAAERLTVQGESGAHSHDFLEIAVVRAGTARHATSAGSQPLGPGDVVVLRPGEWHAYADGVGLQVANCYVGTEVFSRELAWVREDAVLRQLVWPRVAAGDAVRHLSVRLAPDRRDAVLGAVDALVALTAPSGRGWSSALAGATRARSVVALLQVVAAVAEAVPAPTAEVLQPTRPAVVAAAALMEADPATRWTLAGLGRATHVSTAHLGRTFTEDIGVSPLRYLARLRAERAAALLVETDLTVARVAATVGWTDPNLFARRFRAELGLSPTRYRARFRVTPGPGGAGSARPAAATRR